MPPRRRKQTRVVKRITAKTADAEEKISVAKATGGVLEELRTASDCLSHLCLSERLSDVGFIFRYHGTVKLPAHKLLLSMRSSVFEAMFYGPLADGDNTVLIEDIDPDTMKVLLRFIYTDNSALDENNVLRCLYASQKYALPGLVKQCSSFLENNIDSDNVCAIHEQAIFYDMVMLQKKCFDFMQKHTSNVLNSQGFLEVSHATLMRLLKSDELSEEEENIFTASVKWAERQCRVKSLDPSVHNVRETLGDALYHIRFPTMPIDKFATVVTPTKILSSDEQIEIYQNLATKGSTPMTKYNTRKRTGNGFITVNVKTYFSPICQSQKGLLLEIMKVEKYTDFFSGGSQAIGQCKPPSCIRVASLKGEFVPKVQRVTVQQGFFNGNVKFIIERNVVNFPEPIAITDNNGCMIEFHASNESSQTGFRFFSASDRTQLVNAEVQINGTNVCIVRAPIGLCSICFTK